MTSLEAFVRRVGNDAFPLMVSHLWNSTLFLIMVLAVMMLLRRRLTASARFSLALAGILKFAIPAALVMPAVRLLAPDLFRIDSPGVLRLPLQVVGAFQLPAPSLTPSLWPGIVMAVWLAGTLALLFRFTISRRRTVALAVRTALPPSSSDVEALAGAKRRIGVQRSIDVVRSNLAEAPAVLRTFRPLIVLPAVCSDLTNSELESLLCHECAHVARYDNFVARIESIICALFWFHPLIWIAQRITMIERERACDEVVAGSADERDTYMAALTKFCHAAIAPRLPGVSCMATANLKERMEHVMNYSALEARAVSPKSVTAAAIAALVLFTAVAGILGSGDAFAEGTKKADDGYSIKTTARRSGDRITVAAVVSDNKSGEVVSAPTLTFAAGSPARAETTSDGLRVVVAIQSERLGRVRVNVTIEKDGAVVRNLTRSLEPNQTQPADAPTVFTSDPIDLKLNDADLRVVILQLANLTGMNMQLDPAVEGRVTLDLDDVPWDQAFDLLIKQNGLTYRIEGSTIFISR